MVVLLMLIPLLAPSDSGVPAGLATISKALGIAAVKVLLAVRLAVLEGASGFSVDPCTYFPACSSEKHLVAVPADHPRSDAMHGRRAQAVACIGVIIAGGRTLLRPIYRRMADMGNTDVFAATTLLVVLGTSVLTQIAGLSLALGAFLVRRRLPLPLPVAPRVHRPVKILSGAGCAAVYAVSSTPVSLTCCPGLSMRRATCMQHKFQDCRRRSLSWLLQCWLTGLGLLDCAGRPADCRDRVCSAS